MKKKFLIALFVVIIACLFSLTISASNEVTLVGGEKADLTTVFKVKNNQITGFNDGYTKDSVTDVIFPDEIEGIEANVLFNKASKLNSLTFEATDTFFISGDGIFSGCSVKKITFNPNCVVEIRKGNFSSCASLTEITFPKFKKLAGGAFQSCSNMVATNELVLAEGMTEIGGHAFNGCKSLRGTVVFPSTLEKIQEYSFQNTGFEGFDLSRCANLTVAGGGYGGPFTDNDNITTLDLSGCVNLTYLKNSFVSDCENLVNVILPPNLKTIESKALAHCYKLQSIVLPATMETIADEAFHSARNNQTIKTFTVYVQSNVQFGTKYYPFRDSGAKIEFVLIGDNVTKESFIQANTYPAITGATIVDYKDPASPWTYVPGGTITSHTIVENYCSALAITGKHKNNTNPCVEICIECELATKKESPEHSLNTTIKYENGYANEGIKVTLCTNAGCGHNVTEKAVALFICKGFSASNTGNGISLGFGVNNTAIADYTEVTGKTIRYGVFAGSQAFLGTTDLFDENLSDRVIKTYIARTDFAGFDIKVVGFTDGENGNKNSLFAMGAYVEVTDGEETTYSYIQAGTPLEGEKYYFTTFNNETASL